MILSVLLNSCPKIFLVKWSLLKFLQVGQMCFYNPELTNLIEILAKIWGESRTKTPSNVNSLFILFVSPFSVPSVGAQCGSEYVGNIWLKFPITIKEYCLQIYNIPESSYFPSKIFICVEKWKQRFVHQDPNKKYWKSVRVRFDNTTRTWGFLWEAWNAFIIPNYLFILQP